MPSKELKKATNPISESERKDLSFQIDNIKGLIDAIDIDSNYPDELENKSHEILERLGKFSQKVTLLNQTKLLSEEVIKSEIKNVMANFLSMDTLPVDFPKIRKFLTTLSTLLQIGTNNNAVIEATDIINVIHDELPSVIKLPKKWTDPKNDVNMIYGLPVIIAAGTGVGKTTIMTNLIYQYFKDKKEDGQKYYQWVFTLESKVQRLLIELLNVQLKDEEFSGHKINFIETYNNRNRHIGKIKGYSETISFYGNDNMSNDVDIDMIEKSIKLASLKGRVPDIVYIDYLQKIKNDPKLDNSDRRLQIMDTMGRLTQLAKIYNFVIIINSQINRTDRKEKTQVNSETDNIVTLPPDITSMSESSSIEHDAGLILAIGREFSNNGEAEDIFYIKISKNRYGRSGMTYYCKVDNQTKYIKGYISGYKVNLKNKSKSSD